MAFPFKNAKKGFIKIVRDGEQYRNSNSSQVCEKEMFVDKIRDHCHLTSENGGPSHSNCNNNVTQKKSNFTPFAFHNFSKSDCHLFFKSLVDKKMIK